MDRLELTTRKLRAANLGAFFRPRQLEAIGISYDRLQSLVAAGAVDRVGWGLYRFTDDEPTEHYSLAAVCAKVPHSIVCLLSALQVHGIGTQLPHEIWRAIQHKDTSKPLAAGFGDVKVAGRCFGLGGDLAEAGRVLLGAVTIAIGHLEGTGSSIGQIFAQ